MAIALGALVLPSGLTWADEHAWSPVAQNTEQTLTGALVLEESAKLAGRPITLAGASDNAQYTAWICLDQPFLGYSSLNDLRAALLVPGAQFTLTLHDSRSFTVVPRHDGDGPLSVSPLPLYRSFAPAAPHSGSLYVLDAVRLLEV